MQVAVTGSNGFIGSTLCHSLRGEGYGVTPFVRANVHTASALGVSIGSIDAKTDWGTLLEGVDCVVHCAAHVHRMNNLDNPDLFRIVNTDGTMRLATAAANSGVKRFVFVSTVKVMGEFTAIGRPYRSDDTPDPKDLYGISKWEAEQGLKTIAERTGLEVVVVRPPLVYGPGVGANFRQLMGWVARGIPLPVAAIKNQRSLVYVGNLADLVLTCVVHPSAVGQTFFVSDGHDLSTPQLVSELALAMGRKPRMLDIPVGMLQLLGRLTGRVAQVERLTGNLQVDIEHTQRTLDWVPVCSVRQGMKDAIRDFRRT